MPPSPPRRGGWRKWNVSLHRDLGYATAALTIIYAVSGIAVNHVADWNPNYRIVKETVAFAPVAVSDRETMVAQLVERLALPGPPKESYRSSPEKVELFYDGWSVVADATAGSAVIERRRDRPILRDFNFLHLNQPKKFWTYVADLYALVLIFLVVSGTLIPRGRHGLLGKGGLWLGLGFLVPLVAVLVLRYL